MDRELKQVFKTLWRWRWPMIAIVGTTILALILASIYSEPEYQARVIMQITTPEQENVTLFGEMRYASEREATTIANNNFQVVLESSQVRNSTIEELGLVGVDQDYQLDLQSIRDSDFLDIVVTARTPKLAADIANTHAQAAIVRMGELSALRSQKAKNQFAEQLERAKEELSQAEGELNNFQTANGVVDLSSALENSQYLLQQLQLERNRVLFDKADSQTDRVKPIELLITQRRNELAPLLTTRSMHNELMNDVTLANHAVQKAETAEQDSDEALQNARTELQDAESALTVFLLNNDMVALESEIGMLQNQIEQLSLERDRQMLATNDQQVNQKAMIASVNYLIAEREAEINSLRSLEPQFNLLRMNVDLARSRYDFVAGKYSEAAIKANALQGADFLQVVSAAEPPESAESNANKLFVFGLAGGIGFAVLLAFLLEYLQGFRSETESFTPAAASKSQSNSHSIPPSGGDELEGEPVV